MALGAQITLVPRLIIAEGMKPALIGMLGGLCEAIGLGRVAGTLIYGVRPIRPDCVWSGFIVLASTAFHASLIPAYRATA
jgi:hypothetical protein